jgi:hypothetical protein
MMLAGDVGHDAQGEDGQVQQRPAGEQIDQGVQALLVARCGLLEAEAHLFDIDVGGRHRRAETEDREDRECEEDLLA